jgi:ATP-dependent DNA ligase
MAAKKPISEDLFPMEALLVSQLPEGKGWRYEPKWDGFRCLAYKRGKVVHLRSKSGKPLARYFPDIVDVLKKVKANSFVIDGELLIAGAEGYSFSDLQMRLHPAASRVQMLARKQPATFVVFDILETETGENLLKTSFSERRDILADFYKRFCKGDKHLKLSQQTSSIEKAQTWLRAKDWHIDGIVAKNSIDIYEPGERIMQKYKSLHTADCVIGGFRYGTDSKEVGSLLLGLYDAEGHLNHVGFTSGIPKSEKKGLTKKLEKLIQAPGFTGNAPGTPSRWSTERSAQWEPLKPEMVVEVSFDHVTDERFRHGTKLLRHRPDKSPRQCKMEQLHQ